MTPITTSRRLIITLRIVAGVCIISFFCNLQVAYVSSRSIANGVKFTRGCLFFYTANRYQGNLPTSGFVIGKPDPDLDIDKNDLLSNRYQANGMVVTGSTIPVVVFLIGFLMFFMLHYEMRRYREWLKPR